MRTWTDRPFAPVVPLSAMPEGNVLAEGKGESIKVYEIAGNTDWLAKLYRRSLSAPEEARLDFLIAMPASMPPADVDLVDRGMGWPVARITESGRSVGVVMAKAPERFHAELQGLKATHVAKPLAIDWLVAGADKMAKVGLPVPDGTVRTRAMWDLLRAGSLLERHGLVYADWSYSNALWAPGSGEIFVIDMDSCGLTARPWIESPGGQDPLFADSNHPLTTYSDRYKVAVLALRCVTAERNDPHVALQRLEANARTSDFGTLLERMLTATSPTARPSIGNLLDAFESHCVRTPGNLDALGTSDGPGAPGAGPASNVIGYVTLRSPRPGPAAAPPATGSPVPAGAPAAGSPGASAQPSAEPSEKSSGGFWSKLANSAFSVLVLTILQHFHLLPNLPFLHL